MKSPLIQCEKDIYYLVTAKSIFCKGFQNWLCAQESQTVCLVNAQPRMQHLPCAVSPLNRNLEVCLCEVTSVWIVLQLLGYIFCISLSTVDWLWIIPHVSGFLFSFSYTHLGSVECLIKLFIYSVQHNCKCLMKKYNAADFWWSQSVGKKRIKACWLVECAETVHNFTRETAGAKSFWKVKWGSVWRYRILLHHYSSLVKKCI